ncbi:MAG: hypothetical protein WHT07_13135 [Desulfobaccales bacterium]
MRIGETLRKFVILGVLFPLLIMAVQAVAGESGRVSCTAPGCGYATDLVIGGGRASPAVTGYCPGSRKFVRLKLTSWEEYRRPHFCPGSRERLQPIYDGEEVSQFPCPRCGKKTLRYQRGMMFD